MCPSLPVPGQSSTEAGARPLCIPRLLPILPPPTTVAAATPCTPLAGEGGGGIVLLAGSKEYSLRTIYRGWGSHHPVIYPAVEYTTLVKKNLFIPYDLTFLKGGDFLLLH